MFVIWLKKREEEEADLIQYLNVYVMQQGSKGRTVLQVKQNMSSHVI